MTRTQLQNKLRELGCKRICDDGKTLCAYNLIQYNLKCNNTPIKYITDAYVDENGMLRVIIADEIDYESGWEMKDEEE